MGDYLGLYYPFIDFRDEAWLKLTSLYWDRMARIVPAGYGLRDSSTVAEFKDGGYVLDYHPSGALGAPAKAFRALLVSHGERLAQRYGLHLRESWPDDPSTLHSRAAQFGDTRLAYVFGPKIAAELIDDLEALGLAQRGGARDPRWIGMHPRLEAMYMTALADSMAARRKAQPVSDDALSHIGIGDVTMEGLAEALLDDDGEPPPIPSRAAEQLMAGLAINMVVPANLEDLPARRLLDFRDQYAGERAAFQDQIHAMVASLDTDGIGDPDALRDHLQIRYEKLLQPPLADLKRRLREVRIDTTTAVMNIKTTAPAGLTGVGLLMLHTRPLIGTGAVALGVWGVWHGQRRTRRTLLSERPATSYLYQLET